LDGTGYPDGLSGDAIPLFAQIIAIVDVFDALTTERPYKAAVTADAACEELIAEARRGLHRRDLVDTFAALAREEGGDLWRRGRFAGGTTRPCPSRGSEL